MWVEWNSRQDFIAIEVRDSGPGVPEAERRAIFQKFVRGSATTATNAKGSGVGLGWCGTLSARTAERSGRGSVFTMLLKSAERA